MAAVVWIATGLRRVFGGYEKGSDYYLHNHLFLGKMGLLVLILPLEVGPMVSMIQWRRALAGGKLPDTRRAQRHARTSMIQAVLVVLMVLAAAGTARGLGAAAP